MTLLRLVFIPCFVLLAARGHARAAAAVFAVAGITDCLDGLLARRLNQKTRLGSLLDPIADKLLVTSAFITLALPRVPVATHIPLWLTGVTIVRDGLIALGALGLHLQKGQSEFPPSFLGKSTTTAQLITVGTALLGNFTPGVAMAILPTVVYSTLILTVASGLHYLVRTVGQVE